MFLTKESSLVQLAGAAEGTLQSSVVCVSVYACTYVCLLVVKAKPEMDSQMVKRNKVLFRDYCKKGKETSVWKWNQLLINMSKWGFAPKEQGGGLLDGKLLRRNIRD